MQDMAFLCIVHIFKPLNGSSKRGFNQFTQRYNSFTSQKSQKDLAVMSE
jgi:hypothetical protein